MARSDRKNRAIAGGEAAARAQRGVVVDSQVLETDRTASRAGALIFSTALFVALFCVVLVDEVEVFCCVELLPPLPAPDFPDAPLPFPAEVPAGFLKFGFPPLDFAPEPLPELPPAELPALFPAALTTLLAIERTTV